MASRTIHLAIAKNISHTYHHINLNRFYLGSILPDACISKNSHFNKYILNGIRKTHDLTGFRQKYLLKILSDDLYMGYYLHLLEDVLFRYFMFEIIQFDPSPNGNIDQLHRDYDLINRYVIERYDLSYIPTIPSNLHQEPLLLDQQYDLTAFIEELKRDFKEDPQGETVFFKKEHVIQYIEMAVPKCLEELRAFNKDTSHFDEDKYSWTRH